MNTKANQLHITGKVLEICELITGDNGGKEWMKQDVVVETMDQYPKQICFSVWNNNTIWLERIQPGDIVKVSFNASSKKSGDKWFTELSAWRIDIDLMAMKMERGGSNE